MQRLDSAKWQVPSIKFYWRFSCQMYSSLHYLVGRSTQASFAAGTHTWEYQTIQITTIDRSASNFHSSGFQYCTINKYRKANAIVDLANSGVVACWFIEKSWSERTKPTEKILKQACHLLSAAMFQCPASSNRWRQWLKLMGVGQRLLEIDRLEHSTKIISLCCYHAFRLLDYGVDEN